MKVAVSPLVVSVQLAVGVPPAVATVSDSVFELVLPLTLSVTVSVTL